MSDSSGVALESVNRQLSDFFEFDLSKGDIHLHSVRGRAFILPTATWMALRSELLRSFKDGAIPFMFQIGYAVGSSFMDEMKKLDPSAEVIMKRLPDVAAASGWGRLSILGDLKFGRDLTLSVDNCPFCQRVEQTDSPVCDFLAGSFNGIIDNLYARPHEARETKCIGLKGEVCEVRVIEVSEKSDQQRHWGSFLLFPWLFSPKR